MIQTVLTTPYDDQKPGTAGLRKKVAVYQQKNYLENFIASVLDVLKPIRDKTVVIGGDGRYFNREAVQVLIKMLVAKEAGRLVIGHNALLSTPAVSHLIINQKADFGFILSASHNPAGKDGDFGIKVDLANGGGAPDSVTDAIYEVSKKLTSYQIAEMSDIDLTEIHTEKVEKTTIEVVDSVEDYVNYVQEVFDFKALKEFFASGFKMRFDAMNGVTGPYAHRIFEDILGAEKGTVLRGTPLADFGGGHPDPNLTYAKDLVELMFGDNAPDFGAASDGDGDRNMILGQKFFVTPSDSLAILTAHADDVPSYAGKVKGIARSMPTGASADKVATADGLTCYEVPTGWKYFCSLMDAGKITFCGEESFGTGCANIREKDGLWAVLFWLSLLAKNRQSVREIVENHWKKYGRNYYTRYDYENLETKTADNIINHLKKQMKEPLPDDVALFDEWSYEDPVTHEKAENQAIRCLYKDGSRIVFRISGTGSSGKTLRVYMEKYEQKDVYRETAEALQDLVRKMLALSKIRELSSREYPTVIT